MSGNHSHKKWSHFWFTGGWFLWIFHFIYNVYTYSKHTSENLKTSFTKSLLFVSHSLLLRNVSNRSNYHHLSGSFLKILSFRLKRAIFHFSSPPSNHSHINITHIQKRSSQTDNKWKNIKINYDCGEKRFPFYTLYFAFFAVVSCMGEKENRFVLYLNILSL